MSKKYRPFRKFLPLFMIMVAAVALMGTSYALLRTKEYGNAYIMEVGLLQITFEDSETNALNVENAYPMTDEEGLKSKDALEFTIVNTGEFESDYKVTIEETSTNPAFKDVIRYSVNKDDAGYGEVKLLSQDNIISEGNLGVKGKANFKVKVWLAENAGNEYMNKVFTSRVNVGSKQVTGE